MKRVARLIRSHPWLFGSAAVVVAVIGGGAWYAWDQLYVPNVPVSYAVPIAPELAASGTSQTLYRVDPLASSVGYEVEENLAGVEHTATGTTRGIAGDLVIDDADPSASMLGTIVVNVAQFTSDQSLRDRRIRVDFLESGKYPLATFVPKAIEGLPDAIDDGTEYRLSITGDLTVKTTTAPVILDATVKRTGRTVHVAASAAVQLSTFGVGPITVLGLVQTGDDAKLTFDVTFVDPSEYRVARTVPRPGETRVAADAGGPSFEHEVMPVLAQACASCHNDGGVGASVWKLETADDAAAIASGLKLVTSARFMPPWPASEESASFLHDWSLSDDEIQAIVDWADGGGALDVDAATPIEASDTTATELDADVALRPARAYQGSTDVVNDYHCFLLDPGLTERSWITGYQLEPGAPEVVHHALGYQITEVADRERLGALDRAGNGSGWDCDDGFGGTQFMAWGPGQGPTRLRDGTGIRMEPGDAILLQVHYHFAHHAPLDRSTLHLRFADAGDEPIDLLYRTYLAPAEIPCRPGIEQGPLCDRANVIGELLETRGPFGALLGDGLRQQCGKTLEELAVLDDGVAGASCDHTIGDNTTAIAVFGHMHELGNTFRMTLNPGAETERVVLDIANWNFGWQLNYEFETPLELRAGDTLRVECTWDRNRLPVPRNRYVTWSEGTEDEMCYSALTLVPNDSGS